MKTKNLIIGNKYRYEDKEVVYKGETNNSMTFFEFETEEDENGKKTVYPLWEHQVNELVSELNVIKEWK